MFKQSRYLLFAVAMALSCGVNKNAQGLETTTPAAKKAIVVPGDYPTIQAAIDEAEMNTIINVKPGDYKETLTLKSSVSIKGLDTNSVVIYCDARNGPVLKAEDCNKSEISGLTLKHTALENMPADFKGRFPVLLVNSSNLIISRCKIINSVSDGVLITDTNAAISECLISDNNNYGLLACGTSTLSLSDNVFCRNGANGILLKGVHSANVYRNTCSDNAHHGISVAEKSSVNLIQNNCTNNEYSGIFFGLGATGYVKNNTCQSNAYQGILVTGDGTNVLIQENTFSNNNGNGIYFNDKASGSVVGNNCSNNLWHGISVDDKLSSPSIRNNKCLKNKRSGLYLNIPFSATASANEFEDNGDISWSEICELRNADKFEQLENIASRLRKQNSRFANGNWQLAHFYYALGEGWGDMNYFPQIKSGFDDWIKKYPDSATPRIALARAYKAIAWKARGGGYAYKVSEKGWKEFKENLEKAEKVLIEAENLKVPDSELYATWLTVGMGLGKTNKEMDTLFENGVAIEKYYWPLYAARATSILPRWSGRPGQLEAFARHAVELTKEKDGQILYFKIADAPIGMKNAEPQQFKQLGFSYKILQQSQDDLVKRYPDANNNYLLNFSCFLACAYGDKDKAKNLFVQIGSNWDKSVWCDEDIFNKYKSWVLTKTEKLPEPNE